MMSILLVDPDPPVCRFYAVNLSAEGRAIHQANTLAAAWHASLVCRPRLIILEVCGYAEGSGFEFLARLADAADTSHIPVLVITTQTDEESTLRAMKNVRQVLIKPITRHTLLTETNAILGVRLIASALLDSLPMRLP
jgi:DNA-binding response OmpR family regulator